MNEWIGQVLPFWKDLTETEKQMLLTHTALEEYEKGVLLHIDGGDCAGVQIVKEGQVRVYITSPSGGEITLYRLVEGDVSILSASCMIKGMDISLDMEQAVSAQTAQTVKQSLLSVIENPSGTGASAKIDGVTMLGKTGTAEIKESQDDTTGVERGWFICETTEDMPNQIAVVGMVEDVKTKGGSSYVTQKVRNIAVSYLQ